MKRPPMPPRKKGLQAKTELRRTGEPKRTEFKPSAKAILKAAAKRPSSRPKTARTPVIDLVKERSGGLCEIGLKCLGRAPAAETAHRMGKGSGGVGPKNQVSNRAANLLRACCECHGQIDNGKVAEAERLGLKVRHGVALPSEIPVHLHNHNGWVLLDDEGGLRPAPRAAWDRPDGLLPVIDVRDRGEPDYVAIPHEVLSRYGHGGCGGYEWTEDLVVYCVCGPAALFVADLGPVAAPGLAECEVHPVSAAHPECGVCLLCGPCECELAGEWAREVAP